MSKAKRPGEGTKNDTNHREDLFEVNGPRYSDYRVPSERTSYNRRYDENELSFDTSRCHNPYLLVVLKALWADPAFWEMIHKTTYYRDIRCYVKKTHGLTIPRGLPQAEWIAMAKNGRGKQNISSMAKQSWRLLNRDGFTKSAITEEFSKKKLPEIISEYLRVPGLDYKAYLVSQEFSREALQSIKIFADQLAGDARWCLKNPGKFPPIVTRKRTGAPKKETYIDVIESLVPLIAKNPAATDGEIAKMHKPGELDDTVRKAATIARQLAFWREGIQVTFHKKK